MFRRCISGTLLLCDADIREVTGAETGEGSGMTQALSRAKNVYCEVCLCRFCYDLDTRRGLW